MGAAALAACGRIAFEPQSDAMPPDGPCTWSAFSAPAALPGPIQSPFDDWCPTPSDGGLQMYMHSYRASPLAELWVATRSSTSTEFGAPTTISELTTGTSQQFNPTLTEDALHIIYSDDAPGSFDLFEAMRMSPTEPFGAPVALASLNAPAATDWGAFVSRDGLRLMYTSNRGAGHDQIYETSRSAIGAPFDPPMLHGELTVAGTSQWTPTLTADWLDIYFSSTRAGGPGGYDVYTAHRTALDQPFGTATLVHELSSPMDDICMRLTPDGASIYFDYRAVTSGGNADIDVATRTCN